MVCFIKEYKYGKLLGFTLDGLCIVDPEDPNLSMQGRYILRVPDELKDKLRSGNRLKLTFLGSQCTEIEIV